MVVLYRKYRPKNFSEVIGQEHIVQTLSNAVSMGMVSHAYFFNGPRGSGKTTIARLLAKAVNCEKLISEKEEKGKSGFEPCNECSSCQEIARSRAMDLVEIDAASHRGVDDVRDLREAVRVLPVQLKYKVFIIDECHQLSKDAANALLKTLEEPPSHVIFILATTEVQKMIPTIMSRCQRFDFRRLKVPEIIKRLEFLAKKEEVKIAAEALELIALNSAGAFRDAESILDQAITFGPASKSGEIQSDDVRKILGLADSRTVSEMAGFLAKGDTPGAIKFLAEISEKGADIQEFSRGLIGYLRKIMLIKIVGAENAKEAVSDLTEEDLKKAVELAGVFEIGSIGRALDLFLEAENQIKYSPIPLLPLEIAAVKMGRDA